MDKLKQTEMFPESIDPQAYLHSTSYVRGNLNLVNQLAQGQAIEKQVTYQKINSVRAAGALSGSQAISEVLAERGNRYGSFVGHSALSQNLKAVMENHSNYNSMSSDKKEALEMIQHKIARIVNGDSNYKDSWVDLQGYAKLISDTLKD